MWFGPLGGIKLKHSTIITTDSLNNVRELEAGNVSSLPLGLWGWAGKTDTAGNLWDSSNSFWCEPQPKAGDHRADIGQFSTEVLLWIFSHSLEQSVLE